MDYRSLTSLLLRIAGMLILVQLVLAVPPTIAGLLHFGDEQSAATDVFVLTALALVLPLLLGSMLLYFPSVVTNHLIRTGADSDAGPAPTPDLLRTTAFSAIGLYFVCSALFDAVYWAAKLKIYYTLIDEQRWYGPPPALIPDDFAGIASTTIQFVVGLVLLLGASGISHVIGRLRS